MRRRTSWRIHSPEATRSSTALRAAARSNTQSDIQSALAGVPDVGMWEKIVGTIPPQVVAVLGDAIRVPTVIDIMTYDDANVHEHIVGRARRTEADLARLAGKADAIFGSSS